MDPGFEYVQRLHRFAGACKARAERHAAIARQHPPESPERLASARKSTIWWNRMVNIADYLYADEDGDPPSWDDEAPE